ncbi:ATP-binding protein [Bradyrhizobium sp. UFLA05-153]
MPEVESNLPDLVGWTGEFRNEATEAEFCAGIARPARAMALLCVLAETAASLAFVPLDFLTLPASRLVFFLEIRLLIALAAIAALLALLRAASFNRIVAITYVHQFTFFTLNALVFNHPSLTRHGGLLLPLIAIALNLCLPGRFRLVALTSAYAPIISLLFWAVLRPDPESPLDLAIILLVVMVGYGVGAVARAQFNRLRREEYLRIARERRINLDLSEAKDAAEAAARVKTDFLAVMSHEIRTPMNGILGMAQLALDDPLPPAQRKRLSVIKSSAEGLLKILDDILDISKLETRADVYERAPFDLGQAVREIVNLMTPRAHEKGLTLQLMLSPVVPELVLGDLSRVRQVLFNLIGNALKFTSSGGVTVEVVSAGSTDDAVIAFCVSDTGIGVTAGQQAHLFEPFEQADASIRRRFGGTGLGLAICKRLVEGMKGEIGVTSTPGHGSRFHFSLPLPAVELPGERGRVGAAAVRVAPLNLLLVEDLFVNAIVARGILGKAGHRVAVASSGEQAIELMQSARFDAVLMDMQMPDMDGLEATRRIRALAEPLSQVPIVALTANVMATDVKACLAAGMDGHLAKPIDAAVLHRTLDEALARRGRQPSGTGAALNGGGDVLVVGDPGKAMHGPLARLGFRAFPTVSFESARTMLSAREFSGLVAVAPPPGSLRAWREDAAHDGRGLFVIAAPADEDEAQRLLEEGADLVLATPLSPDDVAWRLQAFLAPQQMEGSFELEDVFARARIDELRGLFAESLSELDRRIGRRDLAPEELASIAHRIKGSAANLRMPELAARADDALAAAKAVATSLGARDRAVAALRRQIDVVLQDQQADPVSAFGLPKPITTEREEAHVDDRTRG